MNLIKNRFENLGMNINIRDNIDGKEINSSNNFLRAIKGSKKQYSDKSKKTMYVFNGHSNGGVLYFVTGGEKNKNKEDMDFVTVKQTAEAIIEAKNNGAVMNNMIINLASCVSFGFAERLINAIINQRIRELRAEGKNREEINKIIETELKEGILIPIIITSTNKDYKYSSGVSFRKDNNIYDISTFEYATIYYMDNNKDEIQNNGAFSIKNLLLSWKKYKYSTPSIIVYDYEFYQKKQKLDNKFRKELGITSLEQEEQIDFDNFVKFSLSIFSPLKNTKIGSVLNKYAPVWEEMVFRTIPMAVSPTFFSIMQVLFLFSHTIVKWITISKDAGNWSLKTLGKFAKEDLKNLGFPSLLVTISYIIPFTILSITFPFLSPLALVVIPSLISILFHYIWNKKGTPIINNLNKLIDLNLEYKPLEIINIESSNRQILRNFFNNVADYRKEKFKMNKNMEESSIIPAEKMDEYIDVLDFNFQYENMSLKEAIRILMDNDEERLELAKDLLINFVFGNLINISGFTGTYKNNESIFFYNNDISGEDMSFFRYSYPYQYNTALNSDYKKELYIKLYDEMLRDLIDIKSNSDRDEDGYLYFSKKELALAVSQLNIDIAREYTGEEFNEIRFNIISELVLNRERMLKVLSKYYAVYCWENKYGNREQITIHVENDKELKLSRKNFVHICDAHCPITANLEYSENMFNLYAPNISLKHSIRIDKIEDNMIEVYREGTEEENDGKKVFKKEIEGELYVLVLKDNGFVDTFYIQDARHDVEDSYIRKNVQLSIFSSLQNTKIGGMLNKYAHIWENIFFVAPTILSGLLFGSLLTVSGIALFAAFVALFLFSHTIVRWLTDKDAAGNRKSFKDFAKQDIKDLSIPALILTASYIIPFAAVSMVLPLVPVALISTILPIVPFAAPVLTTLIPMLLSTITATDFHKHWNEDEKFAENITNIVNNIKSKIPLINKLPDLEYRSLSIFDVGNKNINDKLSMEELLEEISDGRFFYVEYLNEYLTETGKNEKDKYIELTKDIDMPTSVEKWFLEKIITTNFISENFDLLVLVADKIKYFKENLAYKDYEEQSYKLLKIFDERIDKKEFLFEFKDLIEYILKNVNIVEEIDENISVLNNNYDFIKDNFKLVNNLYENAKISSFDSKHIKRFIEGLNFLYEHDNEYFSDISDENLVFAFNIYKDCFRYSVDKIDNTANYMFIDFILDLGKTSDGKSFINDNKELLFDISGKFGILAVPVLNLLIENKDILSKKNIKDVKNLCDEEQLTDDLISLFTIKYNENPAKFPYNALFYLALNKNVGQFIINLDDNAKTNDNYYELITKGNMRDIHYRISRPYQSDSSFEYMIENNKIIKNKQMTDLYNKNKKFAELIDSYDENNPSFDEIKNLLIKANIVEKRYFSESDVRKVVKYVKQDILYAKLYNIINKIYNEDEEFIEFVNSYNINEIFKLLDKKGIKYEKNTVQNIVKDIKNKNMYKRVNDIYDNEKRFADMVNSYDGSEVSFENICSFLNNEYGITDKDTVKNIIRDIKINKLLLKIDYFDFSINDHCISFDILLNNCKMGRITQEQKKEFINKSSKLVFEYYNEEKEGTVIHDKNNNKTYPFDDFDKVEIKSDNYLKNKRNNLTKLYNNKELFKELFTSEQSEQRKDIFKNEIKAEQKLGMKNDDSDMLEIKDFDRLPNVFRQMFLDGSIKSIANLKEYIRPAFDGDINEFVQKNPQYLRDLTVAEKRNINGKTEVNSIWKKFKGNYDNGEYKNVDDIFESWTGFSVSQIKENENKDITINGRKYKRGQIFNVYRDDILLAIVTVLKNNNESGYKEDFKILNKNNYDFQCSLLKDGPCIMTYTQALNAGYITGDCTGRLANGQNNENYRNNRLFLDNFFVVGYFKEGKLIQKYMCHFDEDSMHIMSMEDIPGFRPNKTNESDGDKNDGGEYGNIDFEGQYFFESLEYISQIITKINKDDKNYKNFEINHVYIDTDSSNTQFFKDIIPFTIFTNIKDMMLKTGNKELTDKIEIEYDKYHNELEIYKKEAELSDAEVRELSKILKNIKGVSYQEVDGNLIVKVKTSDKDNLLAQGNLDSLYEIDMDESKLHAKVEEYEIKGNKLKILRTLTGHKYNDSIIDKFEIEQSILREGIVEDTKGTFDNELPLNNDGKIVLNNEKLIHNFAYNLVDMVELLNLPVYALTGGQEGFILEIGQNKFLKVEKNVDSYNTISNRYTTETGEDEENMYEDIKQIINEKNKNGKYIWDFILNGQIKQYNKREKENIKLPEDYNDNRNKYIKQYKNNAGKKFIGVKVKTENKEEKILYFEIIESKKTKWVELKTEIQNDEIKKDTKGNNVTINIKEQIKNIKSQGYNLEEQLEDELKKETIIVELPSEKVTDISISSEEYQASFIGKALFSNIPGVNLITQAINRRYYTAKGDIVFNDNWNINDQIDFINKTGEINKDNTLEYPNLNAGSEQRNSYRNEEEKLLNEFIDNGVTSEKFSNGEYKGSNNYAYIYYLYREKKTELLKNYLKNTNNKIEHRLYALMYLKILGENTDKKVEDEIKEEYNEKIKTKGYRNNIKNNFDLKAHIAGIMLILEEDFTELANIAGKSEEKAQILQGMYEKIPNAIFLGRLPTIYLIKRAYSDLAFSVDFEDDLNDTVIHELMHIFVKKAGFENENEIGLSLNELFAYIASKEYSLNEEDKKDEKKTDNFSFIPFNEEHNFSEMFMEVMDIIGEPFTGKKLSEIIVKLMISKEFSGFRNTFDGLSQLELRNKIFDIYLEGKDENFIKDFEKKVNESDFGCQSVLYNALKYFEEKYPNECLQMISAIKDEITDENGNVKKSYRVNKSYKGIYSDEIEQRVKDGDANTILYHIILAGEQPNETILKIIHDKLPATETDLKNLFEDEKLSKIQNKEDLENIIENENLRKYLNNKTYESKLLQQNPQDYIPAEYKGKGYPIDNLIKRIETHYSEGSYHEQLINEQLELLGKFLIGINENEQYKNKIITLFEKLGEKGLDREGIDTNNNCLALKIFLNDDYNIIFENSYFKKKLNELNKNTGINYDVIKYTIAVELAKFMKDILEIEEKNLNDMDISDEKIKFTSNMFFNDEYMINNYLERLVLTHEQLSFVGVLPYSFLDEKGETIYDNSRLHNNDKLTKNYKQAGISFDDSYKLISYKDDFNNFFNEKDIKDILSEFEIKIFGIPINDFETIVIEEKLKIITKSDNIINATQNIINKLLERLANPAWNSKKLYENIEKRCKNEYGSIFDSKSFNEITKNNKVLFEENGKSLVEETKEPLRKKIEETKENIIKQNENKLLLRKIDFLPKEKQEKIEKLLIFIDNRISEADNVLQYESDIFLQDKQKLNMAKYNLINSIYIRGQFENSYINSDRTKYWLFSGHGIFYDDKFGILNSDIKSFVTILNEFNNKYTNKNEKYKKEINSLNEIITELLYLSPDEIAEIIKKTVEKNIDNLDKINLKNEFLHFSCCFGSFIEENTLKTVTLKLKELGLSEEQLDKIGLPFAMSESSYGDIVAKDTIPLNDSFDKYISTNKGLTYFDLLIISSLTKRSGLEFFNYIPFSQKNKLKQQYRGEYLKDKLRNDNADMDDVKEMINIGLETDVFDIILLRSEEFRYYDDFISEYFRFMLDNNKTFFENISLLGIVKLLNLFNEEHRNILKDIITIQIKFDYKNVPETFEGTNVEDEINEQYNKYLNAYYLDFTDKDNFLISIEEEKSNIFENTNIDLNDDDNIDRNENISIKTNRKKISVEEFFGLFENRIILPVEAVNEMKNKDGNKVLSLGRSEYRIKSDNRYSSKVRMLDAICKNISKQWYEYYRDGDNDILEEGKDGTIKAKPYELMKQINKDINSGKITNVYFFLHKNMDKERDENESSFTFDEIKVLLKMKYSDNEEYNNIADNIINHTTLVVGTQTLLNGILKILRQHESKMDISNVRIFANLMDNLLMNANINKAAILPGNEDYVNKSISDGKSSLRILLGIAWKEFLNVYNPNFAKKHEEKGAASQQTAMILTITSCLIPVIVGIVGLLLPAIPLTTVLIAFITSIFASNIGLHVILDFKAIKTRKELFNTISNNIAIELEMKEIVAQEKNEKEIVLPIYVMSKGLEGLGYDNLRNTGLKTEKGESVFAVEKAGAIILGTRSGASAKDVAQVLNESKVLEDLIKDKIGKNIKVKSDIVVEDNNYIQEKQKEKDFENSNIIFEDGIMIVNKINGQTQTEIINEFKTLSSIKQTIGYTLADKMIISLESIEDKVSLIQSLNNGKARKVITEEQMNDLGLSKAELFKLREEGIEVYIKEGDKIKEFDTKEEIKDIEKVDGNITIQGLQNKIVSSEKSLLIDIEDLKGILKNNQTSDILEVYDMFETLMGNIKTTFGIGQLTEKDVEEMAYNVSFDKIPVKWESLEQNNEIMMMYNSISEDKKKVFKTTIEARIEAKKVIKQVTVENVQIAQNNKNKNLEKLLVKMINKGNIDIDQELYQEQLNEYEKMTGIELEQEYNKIITDIDNNVTKLIVLIPIIMDEKNSKVEKLSDENDSRDYRAMLAAA
ncbi:hypothetical protein [Candidatus Ruminimicrobium bovinum]|uniref:hypothetical protein n=1 Tax=Candidatus Ruminimicrobium bovinum TaxID=3242779 RepID=UPI0039B8D4F3